MYYLAIFLMLYSLVPTVNDWQNPITPARGFTSTSSAPPPTYTTYYVNHIGGSRYSTNETGGLCDGTANTAPIGTTPNQHCAFNDLRYLWADGSYNASGTFPGWGWIGNPGDHFTIVDCIQYNHNSPELPNDATTPIPGSQGKCYSGQNGDGTQTNDPYLGRWGDVQGSGAPNPPNGIDVSHPTVIAGINTGSCTSNASKAQIFGRFSAGHVLTLSSGSNIIVSCLEISDSSSCGKAIGTSNLCSYTSAPFDDFAQDGVATDNGTTNVAFSDLYIHGLAGSCTHGPTGDGTSYTRVYAGFCSASGFNFDNGSGTTGVGTLTMSHITIIGNGCDEEYPIVDSFPAKICFDDSSVGYGDGLGTTTVCTATAWHMNIDHATVSYNTQDGIDALHICSTGSSVSVSFTTSYGNMGEQIKLGASLPTVTNTNMVGNCNAMRNAIPGSPAGYNAPLTDFCRAGDQALIVSVSDNYGPSVVAFNTIVSANSIATYFTCADTCNHPVVVYKNNVMRGYINNATNGYPGGGSGSQPDRVYTADGSLPQGLGIFTNPGSMYDHNVSYQEKETCPNTNETTGLCTDPNLVGGASFNITALNNNSPAAGSNAFNHSVPYLSITTDINGTTRNATTPTTGAFEITY